MKPNSPEPIKAEIKKDKYGLWMIIDGQDGTAWAVEENELLPIRNAIDEYMQRLLKI